MSAATQPRVLMDRRETKVARVGIFMRHHQGLMLAVQWLMVAVYLALLIASLYASPADAAHGGGNGWRIARVAFWGIWWPLVLVSVAAFGRVWCGLLCPEGAITEWVSSYGLGRGIPRWMKWPGWPFVTFAATAVFGQLVSLHKYPKPTALVLGGSTVAAVIVGFLYGRGKRIWCRHLCPVAGVFALLAKIAPIHFRVDEAAWETAPAGFRTSRQHVVNCAPLINIRRMESASDCHMCGRCAGERGAVQLAWRSPNAEVLHNESATANFRKADEGTRWLSRLLAFGMIGLSLGAFQWNVSPWLADARHGAAVWLVAHKILWPLRPAGHWWILTNYPQANDVFSWFDGGMLLAYVAAEALIVGGWVVAWTRVAGAATGRAWQTLAGALVPFAGTNLFVGSSLVASSQLSTVGIELKWPVGLPMMLLFLAAIWGVVLAWRMAPGRHVVAAAGTLMATALPLAAWAVQFYLW